MTFAGKRIGQELLGGQPRPAQIAARDAGPRQVQLGSPPLGYRLQLGIEQITGGMRQRAPDTGPPTGLATGPGRIGGVFGRPVQVVDMLQARELIEAVDQALFQRLACQVDNPHARRDLSAALQCANRRRHGVDQAHLITPREFGQRQGIARQHDEATTGQGHEQFPD
ncbi:hypothetical protein D3C79_850090 [compost metagenome]